MLYAHQAIMLQPVQAVNQVLKPVEADAAQVQPQEAGVLQVQLQDKYAIMEFALNKIVAVIIK